MRATIIVGIPALVVLAALLAECEEGEFSQGRRSCQDSIFEWEDCLNQEGFEKFGKGWTRSDP